MLFSGTIIIIPSLPERSTWDRFNAIMAKETGAIPRKIERHSTRFCETLAILWKAAGGKAAIQGDRGKPQSASSLEALTVARLQGTQKWISSVHMYGTLGG